LVDKQSFLIVSDSGIQEEAPSLGNRFLVTHNVTERAEGVLKGFSIFEWGQISKNSDGSFKIIGWFQRFDTMETLQVGHACEHIGNFFCILV
jgi:hypothetical protein